MALTWRDGSDVAIVGPSIIVAQPGTPGAAIVRRLYNNFGGAGSVADMTPKRLKIVVRDTGQVYYIATGSEWTDQHYVEGRIIGGVGGASINGTDWQPLGAGAYLEIPRLANGEGVEIELRIDAPLDAPADAVQAILRLSSNGGFMVSDGLTEATPDGIYAGFRNSDFTHLFASGGPVVENPAGADGQVYVPQQTWFAAGRPYTRRASLEPTTTPAASGLKRYEILSLAADGSLTVTAGAELAVLTDADEPDVPAGEIAIARRYVDDTGVVSSSELVDRRTLAFFAVTFSGLTATVAAGPYARVDNWSLWVPETQDVNIPDNADFWLWLRRSGVPAVTATATPPEPRALILGVGVAASGGVTFYDWRFYVGYRAHRLEFRWDGAVAEADVRFTLLDSDREAFIVPVGMLFGVGSIGDGTADSLVVDLEVERGPEDWQTLFEDTVDRPSLATDAEPMTNRFVPDRHDLPRRARLRGTIDALPTGGSGGENDPAGVVLSVEVAL